MVCIKIDRLIGIITLLLQHDKITAPELAKRFEVSRRTINRDIDTICKAGIPLITIQGYNGGIMIANGYKIDKSLLTKKELQAIFIGLNSIDSVSKISYKEKLIEKLSITPEDIICAENAIFIDLASHYQSSLTQKIATLKQAISQQNEISFCYYYRKGESIRNVQPYLLLFKWSSWYLYAFCLSKLDYRLFKLNRLWNIEIIKTQFSLKKINWEQINFDNYFQENTIHLKALFDKNTKFRLIEEYGIHCYKENENSQLIFEWDFQSYEHMKNWILSFGNQVQVLEPQALYNDIILQAKKILERSKET